MPLTRAPLLLAILLAFASLASAEDSTVVWPLPPAPAGTVRATYPVPRIDWLVRFQSNLDKLKSGPYDLILDGDSITDFWQTKGKDVWAAHFGSIKMADFAIAGDQVQHVLWRLQHGELEGQNPKLIMLMVGTNNLGEDPKEVADGIKLLLNEYETRCPSTHILLLGVFPRGAAAISPARDWVAKVSSLISSYADGKRHSVGGHHARFSTSLGQGLRDLGQRHPADRGPVFPAGGREVTRRCRARTILAARTIGPQVNNLEPVSHDPLCRSE
jgi:lysophospholipase L1-like esterase